MATTAETLRSSLEADLVAAAETRSAARAKLAQLDADVAAGKHRATYAEGGITYDWNGYRRALLDQIAAADTQFAGIEEKLKGLQALAGPFTVFGGAGW